MAKKEIPLDIKEQVEQFETTKQQAIESPPKNKEELKQRLIERGIQERLDREYTTGKGDNAKLKKPRLTSIEASNILREYLEFCLFDMDEGTRLAMYLQFDGIYTQNETIIKRYIFYIENSFSEKQAEDVIYKLTHLSEVRERTNSRYLIPVQNGVFNLETKELEPFSPSYVFTTKIATKYIEGASSPSIEGWSVDDWIISLACGDEEVELLLWQVINDSLNGNYSRKRAIFLVGKGNNGKGSYQSLLTNLIGKENVATLKVNEFDHRFKLSLLEGKTICIGDDVQAGIYIDDSSNFNSVITADRVLIEKKHKNAYGTVFRLTVIQSTNDMPKFRNKSNGTIRRLIIVPFNADFNGEVENVDIKEDYINRQEVLEYVLYKAINMDFEKFTIPTVSALEMDNFIQDNNPVADFKASVFDEWNAARVPIYIVYGFYKDFCEENGYKYLTKRNFIKEFERLLSNEWEKKPMKVEPSTLIANVGTLPFNVSFPNEGKTYLSYVNARLKVI